MLERTFEYKQLALFLQEDHTRARDERAIARELIDLSGGLGHRILGSALAPALSSRAKEFEELTSDRAPLAAAFDKILEPTRRLLEEKYPDVDPDTGMLPIEAFVGNPRVDRSTAFLTLLGRKIQLVPPAKLYEWVEDAISFVGERAVVDSLKTLRKEIWILQGREQFDHIWGCFLLTHFADAYNLDPEMHESQMVSGVLLHFVLTKQAIRNASEWLASLDATDSIGAVASRAANQIGKGARSKRGRPPNPDLPIRKEQIRKLLETRPRATNNEIASALKLSVDQISQFAAEVRREMRMSKRDVPPSES